MGQLHSWITRKERPPQAQTARGAIARKKTPLKDNSAWLTADLPALQGPHQDRPWVQILRALSHGVTGYPGLSPTNS